MPGLHAFEEAPWFYQPWHIQVDADAGFSFFSDVQDGVNPTSYDSVNAFLGAGALLPVTQDIDISATIDFERTSKHNFNFQNFGIQFRKQFLNDIAGDYVSLDIAANMRVMPDFWTDDVAIPYHNKANFELGSAVGKEFSRDGQWYLNTYAYVAIGQANEGYPWFRTNFKIQSRVAENYILGVMLKGYFGTGSIGTVNVDNFDSYARIKHRSIDFQINFAYDSEVWGKLSFLYDHRFYAEAFPIDFNRFELRYRIPIGI